MVGAGSLPIASLTPDGGFYCHSYCRLEIYFDMSEIRLLTLRRVRFRMSISHSVFPVFLRS